MDQSILLIIGVLVGIALAFAILAFIQKGKKEAKVAPAPVVPAEEPVKKDELGEMGKISAVIGVALNLYMDDVHDYEDTILTIQKVVRPYSPWSSKIYGLRQVPQVIKTRK